MTIFSVAPMSFPCFPRVGRALRASLVALALLGATAATAQGAPADPSVTVTGSDELHHGTARRGWFWYKADPKPKEPEPVEEPPVVAPPPPAVKGPVVIIASPDQSEEAKCKQKESWTATCGFIDPGADFEFQAKQRDILLQQMSLTPDKPESVEAAQFYMKWVVGKAAQAANMWYFNMTQNPDLDPTVKNPISEVGIALASRAKDASRYEYFKIIREEGGILFLFSRADCQFCHDQAPYARRVAQTMGLRLINVPLDGKCLPGFEGDACGDDVPPEQTAVLQLKTVPTIFLYVPSNTWIRLGTGIVTDSAVMANTVNFFSAYRAAMAQGLDNSRGARPSVSFNPEINQAPSGTVAADGSKAPQTPDRGRLLELMGYGSAASGFKAR